jgi:hypothetical protein
MIIARATPYGSCGRQTTDVSQRRPSESLKQPDGPPRQEEPIPLSRLTTAEVPWWEGIDKLAITSSPG